MLGRFERDVIEAISETIFRREFVLSSQAYLNQKGNIDEMEDSLYESLKAV